MTREKRVVSQEMQRIMLDAHHAAASVRNDSTPPGERMRQAKALAVMVPVIIEHLGKTEMMTGYNIKHIETDKGNNCENRHWFDVSGEVYGVWCHRIICGEDGSDIDVAPTLRRALLQAAEEL